MLRPSEKNKKQPNNKIKFLIAIFKLNLTKKYVIYFVSTCIFEYCISNTYVPSTPILKQMSFYAFINKEKSVEDVF